MRRLDPSHPGRGRRAGAGRLGLAVLTDGPAAAAATIHYQVVTVRSNSASATTAQLDLWQLASTGGYTHVAGPIGAYVGELGMGTAREGIARTPVGVFGLTQAFGNQPYNGTRLPYFQAGPADWWDGESGTPAYNTHVHQSAAPGPASENLYYAGAVYAHAVVIDYNRFPVVAGAGSGVLPARHQQPAHRRLRGDLGLRAERGDALAGPGAAPGDLDRGRRPGHQADHRRQQRRGHPQPARPSRLGERPGTAPPRWSAGRPTRIRRPARCTIERLLRRPVPRAGTAPGWPGRTSPRRCMPGRTRVSASASARWPPASGRSARTRSTSGSGPPTRCLGCLTRTVS